jgi:hypothetical protein
MQVFNNQYINFLSISDIDRSWITFDWYFTWCWYGFCKFVLSRERFQSFPLLFI